MAEARRERFPGYDVLAKRNGPSWNDATRAVIDRRLATDPEHHVFFEDAAWRTLRAICDRIVPQAGRTSPVPLAPAIDAKAARRATEGYRLDSMPPLAEAWRRGLAAIEAEARETRDASFHELAPAAQDAILRDVEAGRVATDAWGDMPPALFFATRILVDVTSAYYAHPAAWNQIGYGGPASPRGYVRMDFDERDPWEAVEAEPGREAEARRINARVR